MELSKSLIILEGPDRSGKSFLADRLSNLFTREVLHFGTLLNLTSGQLLNFYKNQLLLKSNAGAIWDRSWISEVIYGNVKRGTSRLSNQQIEDLESAAVKLYSSVKLVLCLTKLPTRKQFESRQEYLNYGELVEIRKKYEGKLSKTLDVIDYNFQVDSFESLIRKLT